MVVDASTALSWCFEDESSAYSDKVLSLLTSDSAVVPAIWPVEVSNALIVGERRKRLTEAQTARFVQLLGQLPIEVDSPPTTTTFGSVLRSARRHGLSAYDASYVELAERYGLPLASLDGRLRTAARDAGVALID
jgi:predicted nucleic acid-binding protein